MTIDVTTFLDFAKSLPSDQEIQRRCSISRAYYAAYHACRLRYYPDNTQEGGVHKKLIVALEKSPNKQDRTIGYMLRELRNSRQKVDYELNVDIDCIERDSAISQTEALLEKLNALS